MMRRNAKKEKMTIFDKAGYALDAAIGLISPAAGYKRTVFRDAHRAIRGGYRGAKVDRTNEGWNTAGSSPDADLLESLPKLRERSRDLIRNNPFAGSIAHTLDTNIVGSGIKPQSRISVEHVHERLGISRDQASEIAQQMEDIWEHWVKYADASNRLNFYEMQALVNRQRFENGDVFLMPVMKPLQHGRPYKLAYQVIEADRIATPHGEKGNKDVRAGVKIDAYGAPVSYFVCNGFPKDWRFSSYTQGMDFREIGAHDSFGRKNIIHIYKMLRPDQSRGVPDLASVIESFYHLDQYLEAEIVSARVAACLSLFIKTQPDAMNAGGMGFAGSDGEKNARGQIIDGIEPGMVKYLFEGEDVVTWNPARPGQTFDAFVQVILRMIAAGQNLPYELVAKDYTKSNYSNTRTSLLQAYKGFRNLQRFIALNLCQPAWESLMEEAYLKGELKLPDYYKNRYLWNRVQWLTDGWEWVDPLKDINANTIALNNNITTLSEIAGQRGQDAEEIINQRARELKMIQEAEQEFGVKFPSGNTDSGKAAAPKDNNDSDDADDKKERRDEEEDQ